ncbi:hypothetical protein PV410_24850 [Streptomyces sp. PA03-5A]|nr:hypothetical protein [Streptomyces sp. PA03-5A]
MHRAREADSGRHVELRHIGPPRQITGDLICWQCSAPYVAVRGYTLGSGTAVRPAFRLAPGAEHDENCPLNPVSVTNHIARGSRGLAEVDSQGVLRLALPQDLAEVPPDAPDGEMPDPRPVRHRVATVRPLLPLAVNSAAKIAQVLQTHGDGLADRFTVQPHGGHPIPWARFCYGPSHDAYGDLYRRCRRGESLTHPIAVTGAVQRVNHDRQGRPYIALALNVPAGREVFHVAVRSAHPGLMEPLTEGTDVLAIGSWTVFYGGTLPQLRLWADEHWQLAYWTTGDDGQQTSPRCPAPVAAGTSQPADHNRRDGARPPATGARTGTSSRSAAVGPPTTGDSPSVERSSAPSEAVIRPMSAFPHPDASAGGRRSALGRWLRQVRGA